MDETVLIEAEMKLMVDAVVDGVTFRYQYFL